MENTSDAKQQIIERVNGAKHILVTVPKNPSVDELAAAVGLSLLLDKMDKRPNIIFSGKIPPAISFLEPKKLITQNIDGLRDFIVALSKDKADKLRWKVEEDVVKIFITPYKTALNEKDLTFSQGEFNIEVIIALGVEKNDDLDRALQAQGKILHDASVVTINAGNKTSSLGSIDWQDKNASSICEMLVGVSEAFGSGLLDEQISTALLTGIVANTNRFSNELTTPKVMTMSAQLMSSGANQQLITSNLSEPQDLDENSSANVKDAKSMPKKEEDKSEPKNEVNLDHRPTSSEARIPKPSFRPMPKRQDKPKEQESNDYDETVIGSKNDNLPTLTDDNSEKIGEAKANSLEDEGISENYPESANDTPKVVSPLSENHHKAQIVEPPKFGGALNSLNNDTKVEESFDGSAQTGKDPVSLTHSGDQMPAAVQPVTTPQSLQPPELPAVPDILTPEVSPLQPQEANNESADDYLEQARQAVAEASGDPQVQALPEPVASSVLLMQDSSNVPSPMTNPDWDNSINNQSENVPNPVSAQVVAEQPAQLPQFDVPAMALSPAMPPPLPPLPSDPNAALPPLPTLQNPATQPLQQVPQQVQPVEQPQIAQNPAPMMPSAPSDPGTFPLPPMQ